MTNKRRIVSIILIAALVQILFISFSDVKIVKDAKRYDRIAVNVSKGLGLTEDGKNPSWLYAGAPLVFGGIYAIFGHHPKLVMVFQAILFCLLCVFIYSIGKQCFNAETGFFSAIVCAIYPPLYILPSLLFSEFLFTVVLSVLMFVYILSVKRNSILIYSLTGLFSACLGHIRPNGFFLIFFLIMAAAVLFKDKRNFLRFTIVSLVTFVVFMLPITIRNYIQFKKFMPVAGIEAIVMKNVPGYEEDKLESFSARQTERQLELVKEHYDRSGIDADYEEIREKLKGPLGKMIPQDYTWRPKSVLDGIRRLYIGSYSDVYQIGIPLAFFFKDRELINTYPGLFMWKLLLLSLSFLVFVLAVLGLCFCVRRFISLLPLFLPIVYNTLFYIVYALALKTDITTRYGLPVLPFIIIFAVFGTMTLLSKVGVISAGALYSDVGKDVQ